MKKKIFRKKVIIPVIIVLIILVIIIGNVAGGAATGKMVVTTATAKIGHIEQEVSSSGTVQSDDLKFYYAPATLKVGEIIAENGDLVKKGDVILKFDSTDMEMAVKENQLNIDIAEAGYNDKTSANSENTSDYSSYSYKTNALKAEIDQYEAYIRVLEQQIQDEKNGVSKDLIVSIEEYQQANMSLENKISNSQDKSEIERLKKEIYTNNVAISQLQTAQQLSGLNKASDKETQLVEARDHLSDLNTEYAEAKAKRDSADAQKLSEYSVAQLDADNELRMISLNQKKDELSKVKDGVVAEFDGVITDFQAKEGVTIVGDAPVLTLASMENVSITIGLGKYEVQNIEIGQKATIKIAGKEYTGTVDHINHMASAAGTTNATSIDVRVKLDDSEGVILGIDGKVSILVGAKDDALIIPAEAVNTDKTGDFVYVVENDVIKKVYVKTGLSSVDDIEILEGIKSGDKVVSFVVGALEDGMTVNSVDGDTKNDEEGEE